MFTAAGQSQTFLQLITLCQDCTLVGMKLLEKISSVPHGELSCSKLLVIFLRFGPKQVSRKSSEASFSKTVFGSFFLFLIPPPLQHVVSFLGREP